MMTRLPDMVQSEETNPAILDSLLALTHWLAPEDNWTTAVVRAPRAGAAARNREGRTEGGSGSPRTPKTDVRRWLKVMGHTEGTDQKAETLTAQAVRTLLDRAEETERGNTRQQLLADARRIGKRLSSSPYEQGRLAESDGDVETAIELYAEAGTNRDRTRALRKAGRWHEAVGIADDDEKEDAAWLAELKEVVERQPAGLSKRLWNEEAEHVASIAHSIGRRTQRRHAGR